MKFETKNDTAEIQKQLEYIERGKEIYNKQKALLGRDLTCNVTTFGCQMNARDSEKLSGILRDIGYVETESEDADLVIYNTCTVRDNANQKVYGKLGVLNGYKRRNPDMKIALCGCMMQEKSVIDKIEHSYRFVDLIFGTHNLYKFPELYVKMMEASDMVVEVVSSTVTIAEALPVNRKYSYKSGVNIMFGCDNVCTYCIVPYVRGRERSRDKGEIIEEIKALVKDGVKEVMLLGQNVNSYGKNLEDKTTFAELLREVEKVEGLERIRFMTSNPYDLPDELIEVIRDSKKICRHLHLPLQSGSTEVLKKMNRRHTKEEYLELVDKIKREIPDISLTTDIIVGFPTETHKDVDDTIDVINKVGFDNAFTFIYSPRTGTPAAKMPMSMTEEEIKYEFDRVLSAVQENAKKRAARFKGQTLPVLVEEINEKDSSYVTGRLSSNMLVHFKGDSSLIGNIVDVRLDECRGFYYYGEMVER